MLQFPVGKDDAGAWRLDIVALLAVTGEGFIHEHAQAVTSSALCIVPRIMPAPQALMRPWRPVSLPSEPAKVTGVYSGIVLESLGFFANIIHPLDFLRPFEFKVIAVRHRPLNFELRPVDRRRPTTPSQESNETQDTDGSRAAAGQASGPDVEQQVQYPTSGLRRRVTFRENVTDFVSNAPTLHGGLSDQFRSKSPPMVYSPLQVVAIFSILLTIGLIVAAALWKDGTAMLAIILVSFATSTIGYGAWWRPRLIVRARMGIDTSPPGDMIIRTREGAFLLIKCSESVARELYTGAEECEYIASDRRYRILMVLGAILIMPAVILFGNCTFNMQALVGAAYMILNVIYWSLGLLPKRYYWDLSRYEWEDITPQDARSAHHNSLSIVGSAEGGISFTRTMWYAIRETKSTGWVERSGSIPATPQWKQWLREAGEAAQSGNRMWEAVTAKDRIMKDAFET